MKPTSSVCFFIGLVAAIFATDVAAEQSNKTYSESQIKVALVYKLMHFIEWPPNKSLKLCVYNPNKEDIASFRLMPAQVGSEHPLEVMLLDKKTPSLQQSQCQIVFFSKETDIDIQKMLTDETSQESLTIGETHQFIKQGGMINLVRKDLTIKFEINISALKRADLAISSQVLRIADTVYGEDAHE